MTALQWARWASLVGVGQALLVETDRRAALGPRDRHLHGRVVRPLGRLPGEPHAVAGAEAAHLAGGAFRRLVRIAPLGRDREPLPEPDPDTGR